MRSIFNWKNGSTAVGMPFDDAARLMARGRTKEMMEQIYESYRSFSARHDLVVVEGALPRHLSLAVNFYGVVVFASLPFNRSWLHLAGGGSER